MNEVWPWTRRGVDVVVGHWAWLSTLLLCLNAFSLLDARAYPQPSREVELLDQDPSSVIQWGQWVNDGERGVWLQEPNTRGGWNIWVPRVQKNFVDSGIVRARVELGKRADFALLFRASVTSNDFDGLSGYGLGVERGRVTMYRWDDGVVRAIATGPRLPESVPSTVDVNVVMTGPHMVGTVVDPKTSEVLSTVMVSDARWRFGFTGFRAHSRQSNDTRFRSLAVNRVGPHPQYDETIDVFGIRTRAWVSGIEREALTDVENVTVISDNDGVLEVLLANRTMLPMLEGLGGVIERTTGLIPRRALDEDYRIAVAESIRRVQGGVDLSRSFKDGPMVEAILRAYAEAYPKITRLHQIGTSRMNRPIWALRITDNPNSDENEPVAMFVAAHHGSELMAIEFALDAIDKLLRKSTVEGRLSAVVRELDIWVVPLVNPDGNHCHWNLDESVGRKNCWDMDGDGQIELEEGVDLNRNYPFQWGALGELGSKGWPRSYYYRGPEPASEPETRAIMALASKYRPAILLSWHTSGNMIFSPPTIDNVQAPTPDVPWMVAEKLVYGFRRAPTRRRPIEVRRNMYSVDGTDQDWHYASHGTFAYIVEGPHHNPTRKDVVRADIAYMRPIFNRAIVQLLQGPRLSGNVVNDRGAAVDAIVEIREIQQNAGERWNTRPSDGRFDRLVGESGTYTLSVRADGYAPWEKQIAVRGAKTINVVMMTLESGQESSGQ